MQLVTKIAFITDLLKGSLFTIFCCCCKSLRCSWMTFFLSLSHSMSSWDTSRRFHNLKPIVCFVQPSLIPPRKQITGFFLDSNWGLTSFHLIQSVFFVELFSECFHTGKKLTIKITPLPPRANVAAETKKKSEFTTSSCPLRFVNLILVVDTFSLI